jgi:hypothetical protein
MNQPWGIFETRTFENYFVPDTANLKKDIRPIESYYSILVKMTGNELFLSWDSSPFNTSTIQGSSIDNDFAPMFFMKNSSSANIQKSSMGQLEIGNDTLHYFYFNFSDVFANVSNTTKNINVFPNPVSNTLKIKSNVTLTNSSFSIINLFGQNIQSGFVDENQIDVQNIANGHYIVLVTFDGIVHRSNVIISR